MSDSFYQKWIRYINPSSGRLVRESGARLNFADVIGDAQDISKALTQIELEHKRIHDGLAWSASVDVGSINSTASKYVLIKNTSDFMHFRTFTFEAIDGPFTVKFFEAPTTSANGTLQTIFSRNRTKDNSSSLSVYLSPTVSAEGNLLEYDILGGSFKSGGTVTGVYQEWILKKDTDYLFKFTNVGNQVSGTNILNAFWYRGNLYD